jgi:hypothetical protein
MAIIVNRECTRFTIAFSFKCNNEKEFGSICQKFDEIKNYEIGNINIWTPIDYAEKDSELYATVQKFTSREKLYAEESIGRAWVLNKDHLKFSSLHGTYHISEKKTPVLINSAGLFLFKTGVGIFWYEIENQLKDFDEIIRLNWGIKYVSHSDRSLLISQLITTTLKINCLPQDILSRADTKTVKVINMQDQYIHIDSIPTSGNVKKVYCKKENDKDVYYALVENSVEYSLKEFISNMLAPLSIVTYFTENLSTLKDQTICPDKAYVFSVVVLENDKKLTNDVIEKYLFWLSRGYKQSYLPPPEGLFYEVFHPFNNSFWSASMEGCANIVCLSHNEETTDIFFKNGYWERYEINFYMYILVLHQYHTLLNISNQIGKLPIEVNKYNNVRSESFRILSKYNEMINLFSMRIFFSQISHISHQNELYNYLIQRLEIKKCASEMKDTLQVVNDIVNNVRQNKRSQYLRIFVILGAVFTLIQTISNIIPFYERGISSRLPFGTFLIVSLMIILIGSFVVWLVIRLSKLDG